MLDLEGPFGWGEIERGALESVLGKLREFEKLTWGELEQASRNTTRKGGPMHHVISVDRLSKEARDRLREIRKEQVDEIFGFRLTSTNRVWGVRIAVKCHLLWWDPDHKVYKSKGK